ncbi:TIGR02147 family protein [Bdellovibrio sp. HCB209]|uniref:TIGR02147 family protein n=1 Tax=Bdellovibrio sp. HCB209 TaxID=3394354 RepID=UPI0039B419BE
MVKPQIMSFVDYRQFLQAWYHYSKSQSPHFSYATWSRQCGFKSRSFLSNVLHGNRNLGEESISLLLNSLKLSALECEYFEHLVLYANSTNFLNKEYHFQQIVTLNKSKADGELHDIYKFLSNPKTPRVHLLLSLHSLNCTADFVAQTFQIPKTEAAEILQNIKDCGLAEYDEASGNWRTTQNDLRIPDNMGNTAVQSFHKNSLNEALEAMMLPPSERRFDSLVMTLTDMEFTEIKTDIDQFLNFLNRKYTSKVLDGARVCQLNLNIVPTSQPLEIAPVKANDNFLKPLLEMGAHA